MAHHTLQPTATATATSTSAKAPWHPAWAFLALCLAILAAFPAFGAGSITVEFNAPYNLVVDSNVCSPSTYAPRIATVGAGFCNYGDAPLTDVVASIGDFAAQTPGDYPDRDSATGAGDVAVTSSCLADSGIYELTHLGDLVDATRYIGDLDVGQCSWQYWSFTYPRRENPDTCGDPVWCASNDPNDDLWLDFDVWATSAEGAAADDSWTVTMRNEISASANKIYPNGGLWFNEPSTCQPGQTVTTSGVNYELGVVNKGFDNDGDGQPDYNAWLQPIGDENWNPACFRLVRTEGQLQISRSGGGGTDLVDFVDQLYFTDLGANNGVIGVVEYTFMCLGGACAVPLTPYQEAASGFDNEKFAGDYGTSTVTMQTEEPDTTLDKSVAEPGGVIAGRAEAGETLDYTLQVDNGGDVDVGLPDFGMPLVLRDSIPAGTSYAAGSAGSSFACCGVTILYSTNGGSSWTGTEPATASNVTDIQWRLQDPFPVGATGTAFFSVVVDSPYSGDPVILNTGYASFGDAAPFAEADAGIPVAGGNAIGDTIFRDDGTGGGTVNDGTQNGTEPVISGIGVDLYWDVDGDGELSAADILVGTTTSGADGSGCGGSGNYCFDNVAAGDYLVVVDTDDVDATEPGYRLTTPTPGSPSDTVAVTGLGSGGDETVASVDFGFGPSLSLTKTTVGPDPAIEGELVTYTIDVTNNRPANQACTYDIWGANYNVGSSDFVDSQNAAGAQGPDGSFAEGGEGGSGNDLVIEEFLLAAQTGNISSVELLVHFYTGTGTLVDDDLGYTIASASDSGNVTGTVSTIDLGAFSTTAADADTLAIDISTLSAGAWDFGDFVSGNVTATFDYKHTGQADNVTLFVDGVGLRVTTDETCGAPSDNMQTVPLTDTYDADTLIFDSAIPPVSSSGTSGVAPSTTGTLTWDLGPLLAGETTTVTVNFIAREQDSNGNGEADTGSQPHVNTADVTSALFFDGGPVNDASDTASHTVQPTGFISGYVWADSGGDPQIGADVNDGQFDSALGGGAGNELGIAGVTVQLTGPGCAPCSTTTDSDGNYEFTGLADGNYTVTVLTGTLPGSTFTQFGDPDTPGGVCGTCDDQTTAALVIDLATDDGANFDYTNVDFGYDIPAVVFGSLWEDADGDGVEDPGEGPLAGVTVELRDCGANAICGDGDDGATIFTSTDANGDYRFEDLTAGNYEVFVDSTTGPIGTGTWNQTFDPDEAAPCGSCDDTKASFALLAGNVYGTYDFAYQEVGTSSVGDSLYADWDGDGVQDAGEEGIPNVTIYLYEDANGDGVRDCGPDGICGNTDDVDALRAVTATDASGNYTFSSLPAGDWIVVVDETDPDFTGAYTNLSQTQDPDEAGVCVTCDGTAGVTTDGTNPVDTIDMGYQPTGFSSIGDLVWDDADGDGLLGAGESGLINVSVTLYEDSNNDGVIDAGDAAIGSTVTDSNGNYAFYNLPAGNYLVDVDENSASIPQDAYGNDYILSAGSDPADVTLGADEDYLDADFGFAPGGTIGDVVFRDDNGDGDQSVSEPGINNVTVNLYLDVDGSGDFTLGVDTLVDTQVTSTDSVKGDGFYQFTGLAPGDYVVAVDTADPDLPSTFVTADPDATLDGETGLSLATAQNITFADFGFQPPNVIGDYVWLDENGDGVQDIDEAGIPNVSVDLYRRDLGSGGSYTLLTSTTTDGSGLYTFGDLGDGEYFVWVDQLGASLPASDYQQTFDPDEAGVCSTCDQQGLITINGGVPGGTDFSLDFGFQRLGDLEIDKDTSTPNVNAGGQATYTVRIVNVGGAAVTLARITDALPTGSGACSPSCFTYASSTVTLNDATETSPVAPTVGDTSLTFGQWTIQAGGSVTVEFVVDVASTVDPGTYDNTAAAAADSDGNGTLDISVDDVGTTAQDTDTPTGLDPEADEDVTVPDVQLAITKTSTIVGDAGNIGSVDPGETLEYTISVSNNGTATANNVEVTDAVPTGTTYDGGFGVSVAAPVDENGTYADDFDGGSGTLAWAGGWAFTGTTPADDPIADAGDPDLELALGKNDNATRTVGDLSVYSSATLTFNYRRVQWDSADVLTISLGGQTLGTITGTGVTGTACTPNPGGAATNQTDGSYLSLSCTVPPAALVAGAALTLNPSVNGGGSGEFVYIDDVVLTVFPVRNPTGGPFVGSAPSTLVPASAGYSLQSGETMTVVWRVTANSPLPVGQTSVDNQAFATSDETPSPVDDTASDPIGGLPMGSIAGTVWDDDSNATPNGVQDVGEPGLQNIRVELYDSGDNLVDFVLTDSSGAYQFDALPDDTYTVVIVESTLPTSYSQTGDPDEAGVCSTCDSESTQAVAGGASVTGVDFGYQYSTTPLPVTLSSFKASLGDSGVLFEWTTETETRNVGFFLFADVDGDWVQVNDDPVLSQAIDSTRPLAYSYETEGFGLASDAFVMADVDTRGKLRFHGPFPLGESDVSTPPVQTPVAWGLIRQQHEAEVERRRGGWRQQDIPNVRLSVAEDGLYRVRFEDLLDAGIDMSRVPLSQLALTDRFGPVPIWVDGKGTFGPGESIEFYGEAFESLYTDTNLYTLRLDASAAERIDEDRTPPARFGDAATVYRETVRVERDRQYSFGAPDGDPWYDVWMSAIYNPTSLIRTVSVEGYKPDAGPAVLDLGLWGVTDWPASPDHHVVVSVNGTQVAEAIFDGSEVPDLSIELPDGVLLEGENELRIDLPLDLGVAFDLVALDAYSVTYPRHLAARDGHLSFQGDAAESFSVSGLPGADPLVYRIDGESTERLMRFDVSGAPGDYTVTFAGASEPASYLVATPASGLTPEIQPAPAMEDIFAGEAEYLVIAHPDFLGGGLDPLIAAREAQGFTVQVVDVEQIYENLSGGAVDAEAIREYVAYAVAEKGTEYVLLVGGDSYDYTDNLGLGGVSFIPSLYIATHQVVNFAPADPLYGDVDRDSVPDVPVGRFPVRTTGELDAIVAKTLDYQEKDYGRTLLTASDAYVPSERVSFSDISEELVAGFDGWQIDRADIDTSGLAAARAQVVQSFNDGVAVAHYFGHSSFGIWSFQQLFTSAQASQLTNHGRPAAVIQWGCWNTYYVTPYADTLGHKLMLSGDQGAAAVLGAGGLTQTESDQALGALFLPLAIEPGTTLGQALVEAKQALSTEHPEMLDVIAGWTILGDPALVIEPAIEPAKE